MYNFDLAQALSFIVILLISIDIHELAHAIVADRLGDPTPRSNGELSLNPFVHMDQIGIVLLLLTSISHFGFTYGRTHVNPTRLKFGPQRGNAIVAIVGPISNLLLAALASVPLAIAFRGGFDQWLNLDQVNNIANFLFNFMRINVFLFIFNLVPIPPLDGFSVLGGFLSARQMYQLAPLRQWGPIIFLVLVFGDPQLGILSHTVYPAVNTIDQTFCSQCPSV